MPFLSLPLEIREMIYHCVLCPPGGIDMRIKRDDQGRVYSKLVAWPSIPTALLHTNHQISQEASSVLFRHNRFNFDTSAKLIYWFLYDMCQETIYSIRNVSFGPKSTALDDTQCENWWNALSRSTLLQRIEDGSSLGPLGELLGCMHLERLTFMLPGESESGDESELRVIGSSGMWWPAVDVSLVNLLRGDIQMLRLQYPKKYTKGKAEDATESDPYERFAVIRRLRGICQDPSTRNFAVKWTSNVDGDGETVLELTKVVSGQTSGSAQ